VSKSNKKTVDDIGKTSLELTEKAVEKEYGKGIITMLGDHESLKIEVISTGCLALDSQLGIGGFARGRLYEIYGPNSSGKSTLALSAVMQALRRDLNVLYVDAEHSLDPKLVRNMGKHAGVDVNKIKLVQAYTGDDNLEITEKLVKTGDIDIAVIDSVTSLLPKAMSEGDIGDDYMGQLARLMSKACQKLTPVIHRTNTLLIFINQLRDAIGKWGDSRVPTGGNALGFYTSGRIKVEGGETKSSRIEDDDGVVIGHRSNFLIIKNKLSPPWRTAEIDLIYGKGYDYVKEVVDLSVDCGFISQAGAWYEFEGEKVNGKANLINRFREDILLYEKYRKNIRKVLGLEDEYTIESDS
jgi:recombination protein RecA